MDCEKLEGLCNSVKDKRITKRDFKNQIMDITEDSLNEVSDECRYDTKREHRKDLFLYLIDEYVECVEDSLTELLLNKSIDEVDYADTMLELSKVEGTVREEIEGLCVK